MNTHNKDIIEARKQLEENIKDNGTIIALLKTFSATLKEEWRQAPIKSALWFIFSVGLMFGIMFMVSTVNDELRYCQITNVDGGVEFDGSLNKAINEWNKWVESVNKGMIISDGIDINNTNNIVEVASKFKPNYQKYHGLFCKYDIKRAWCEFDNQDNCNNLPHNYVKKGVYDGQ